MNDFPTDLAPLIGTWRGQGHGDYPTIEAFDYFEEVTFSTIPGKPFLVYIQKTKHAETGAPLHAEAGYVRSAGPGRIEMTIAQPTGIVEIHTGTVADGVYSFASETVATTPTAVDVTACIRTLTVAGNELSYVFSMEAVGEPMTKHLVATLTRV
ncbi:MAG: FABP family protein [Acidimicrobiia bacterium]|nr:FABP family protein [Acidimicrobiia bacterium]MDH5423049.1 FABP family protein [Acidimicrobiia bacterium]MDH5502802.1 FABP family protein [Acidimicrobiia bacterium]